MSERQESPFIHRGDVGDSVFQLPKPEFLVQLREDDGTLIVGIRPDGSIQRGPTYQPDAAAREFWDAVTRAAQAASPWRAT